MHLEAGDTIAIVATARKITREEITPAIVDLESWGLKVVLGPHLFETDHQYAGTDDQRAEALQWALEHPNIKAVLCARGGYGTIRLMDKINLAPLRQEPKLICGFSDITMLHSALDLMDIPSIHGTMPLSWPGNTPEAKESLRKVLFGEKMEYSMPPHPLNRPGSARGRITGGNLSLLYALTGTGYQLNTEGKILFIEDLDEYLYHIDRMMQNLRMSGLLNNLSGLLVGGMTDMRDNAVPFGKHAEEIIHEAVSRYTFPVVFNFPAGHVSDNRALLLGAEHILEVNEGGARLLSAH